MCGGSENRTDSELVRLAQNGDLNAEEAIMRKYKGIVRMKSKMYYMAGADEDDIVQEGMIGLLKAIRQFDPGKDAAFATFAGICITRQIISAIRTAGRDKHKALNTYVSLSRPVTGSDSGEMTIADTLMTGTAEDPQQLLVLKDLINYILNNGDDVFSDFEMQVLNEFLKNREYAEISDKLGKSVKSVENAVQRAKRKIITYIWQ